MNRSLIIGDCHIGKGVSFGKSSSDGLNSRIIDQINILNWILNYSINNNISRLILTGDIFEEARPDTVLVVIFVDWLKSCVDCGIDVHIIVGNHDLKRVGNRYTSMLHIIEAAEIDGIYIYNRIHTIHTPGVSFTMMPFRDRRALNAASVAEAESFLISCLPYELSEIPTENKKVVVGHLAFEGSFITDEVDDVSNEIMISPAKFLGYDYVWMGHVHAPQVVNKNNPYAAHVGSMDISDFGETKHKKIMVLFDPDSSEKFKNIEIPTRPMRRVRIDIPKGKDPTEHLSDILKDMNKESSLKDSTIKIEIKIEDPNASEIDRNKINNLLSKYDVYHIASFSESKNVAVVPSDKKHIDDCAIEPRAAVKLWTDLPENECDDKEELTTLLNDIISEHEAAI
jgi:exonuclease SbcD